MIKVNFKMKLLAVLGSLFFAASTQATIIFSDNFNGENGGSGIFNYTGFTNWTVSNGSVDLIGNGYFDLQPGNGLYVDMDGTTGNAGKMTSIDLVLAAGTYALSFDLAGNNRNHGQESVNVEVNMGSLLSESISLGIFDPFQTFTRTFSIASDLTTSISFEGTGGDNIGMLLDNVVLESVEQSSVPEPLSLSLLGIGLVGIGLGRKRRSID